MGLNDLVGDGQTQTITSFSRRIEGFKNVIEVFLRYSTSVIPDPNFYTLGNFLSRYANGPAGGHSLKPV